MHSTGRVIDAGPGTFFGVPSLRDLDMLDAQVAFLGVPYDGGTPQPGIPTGQRAGPAAAREATRGQFYYPRAAGAGDDQGAEGWYDVEADRDYLVGVTMADVGDVAIQGSDTEANYGRITCAARGIVEHGALMVAIGGDHSISYPLGRGMEPLGEFDVVHVDAHTDFFDELDGARLTGASQLRRLAELPFVGTVTALGVRNVDRAEVDAIRELGGVGRRASTYSSAEQAKWCARPSRGGGAVRLDRPRRARLLGRAGALVAGAGRAQLPAAARDLGRGGAAWTRDRLRRRRAESGARPVRGDVARGYVDRHALSERDLRSTARSQLARVTHPGPL